MANAVSNHAKYMLVTGGLDLSSDSIKAIVMNTGFTFNIDTHATYANISASELATGNGYTQDTATLDGVAATEDDTDDRAEVTWSDEVWTASGGNIGPTPGACLYDDTSADNTVLGFIDFGSDRTITPGGTLTLDDPEFRVS